MSLFQMYRTKGGVQQTSGRSIALSWRTLNYRNGSASSFHRRILGVGTFGRVRLVYHSRVWRRAFLEVLRLRVLRVLAADVADANLSFSSFHVFYRNGQKSYALKCMRKAQVRSTLPAASTWWSTSLRHSSTRS
eukprot:487467-Pleurochrysis_carterae.AAC.1